MNYYEASAGERPRFALLQGEQAADVCVIGGGFTGLSAALHLAERGFSVALLEAGRVGCGASGSNGGQVGSGQRCDVAQLERRFGRTRARLLWDLAEEAKAIVAGRIERHAIDCQWRAGNLLAITRPRYVDALAAEARHLATQYGYQRMRMLDRAQMRDSVDSAAYVAGRMDEGGGHLHPLRFALGLARAARAAGARLYEASAASRIEWGAPSRVHTASGAVRAAHVVLCANAYLGDALEPRITGRIMPITSHLLATEPLDPQRARATIRDGCCVHATRFVVDYFRFSAQQRLIFGGGETYCARAPRDAQGFVRRHMLRVFPQFADLRIDYAWSGRLAITMDRLPEFGRVGRNGWFVHGFSGHGVALSQLAGRLLAEAVAGSAERFDVFAGIPHLRFPGGPWLRHPLLVAGMLWYALRDRL